MSEHKSVSQIRFEHFCWISRNTKMLLFTFVILLRSVEKNSYESDRKHFLVTKILSMCEIISKYFKEENMIWD